MSVTSNFSERDVDVVVVGAGITGLHMVYRLRSMGLTIQAFDMAPDVGGTWFWNRYPGARLDSESYTYAYSFSEELLEEWNWSELFAAQPEIERYIHYVADKFDLRRHYKFQTRVVTAHWDDCAGSWIVETDAGDTVRCKYLITAVGILSDPYIPHIEGMGDFHGQIVHTGRWPVEGIELEGKRVAVIGTGASAVQLISAVAPVVEKLAVYQRTPMFVLPLNNSPIPEEEMRSIKDSYPEIIKACNETFNGFIHGFNDVSVYDHTREQRLATYEQLYSQPGFAKTYGSYYDIRNYPEILEEYGEFLHGKLREQIQDPGLLSALMAKDHLLTTRRAPMDNGYYEVYKRDNVSLLDIRKSPIERITATGIVRGGVLEECDVIVLGTGFDAFVGAFNKIDICGRESEKLAAKWADGPKTYLGLQVAGFPNLFTCLGPHNKGVFCNVARCSEQNVQWVSDCIQWMEEHGASTIEPTAQAEEEWTRRVNDEVAKTTLANSNSFYFGSNIPGKARAFLGYFGPFPEYRKHCDEIADDGYRGFDVHYERG